MQFSILSIAAAALSASVAFAAPASVAARTDSVTITFEGADPAASFDNTITLNAGWQAINPPPSIPEGFSVSYISFTKGNVACNFQGVHDGAATGVAVQTSYGHYNWGPPQPVASAACSTY